MNDLPAHAEAAAAAGRVVAWRDGACYADNAVYAIDAIRRERWMPALSERDMRVLAFERGTWRTAGAKEQAIAEVLGITATRYYQLLNELIDTPEALRFDPTLVKRLRSQRARRQRIRSPKPGA
jgi:hypothetical protein